MKDIIEGKIVGIEGLQPPFNHVVLNVYQHTGLFKHSPIKIMLLSADAGLRFMEAYSGYSHRKGGGPLMKTLQNKLKGKKVKISIDV